MTELVAVPGNVVTGPPGGVAGLAGGAAVPLGLCVALAPPVAPTAALLGPPVVPPTPWANVVLLPPITIAISKAKRCALGDISRSFSRSFPLPVAAATCVSRMRFLVSQSALDLQRIRRVNFPHVVRHVEGAKRACA
jgi:hypothetical protein